MTYNKQTKKNQGDKIAHNVHDGDQHMIFEQKNNPDCCPVRTYEMYMSKLTMKAMTSFKPPTTISLIPSMINGIKNSCWCGYNQKIHGMYF